MFKKILLITSICILSIVLLFFFIYIFAVVSNPPEYIRRDNIIKLISTETPVYYSDGENKLGVFFAKEHRQFVKFDSIPKTFINALIASEDKNFFTHKGFDLVAIFRAILADLKAMSVVQGGSTITQQTAKNLFGRESRSFGAKWRELFDALRLEYYYTKEEILEFYVNQFFVNSNGRGLGIAAEYFFNKRVSDLTINECAFIAGAVKAPNKYNPYIVSDPIERANRLNKAFIRRNYVLSNMYKRGYLKKEEYEEIIKSPVDFQMGKFIYDTNVLLDMAKNEILSRGINLEITQEGFSNFSSEGNLAIYTTIDRELQESFLYRFRKGLSSLDLNLHGYESPDSSCNTFKSFEESVAIGGFYIGKIESINHQDWKKLSEITINVKLGIFNGIIKYSGILNAFLPWLISEGDYSGKVTKQKIMKFLSKFIDGEDILVSVKEWENEIPILEIEKCPKINGGLIALEDGKIRALVGGFTNRDFNRAIVAKRQPGSTMKPLLYAASLGLKWSLLDELPNYRRIFPYMESLYIPRPDHWPAPEYVSLAWSGAKSENIASVYLLYHLLDKLQFDEFSTIVDIVGLSQRNDETESEYIQRMRDKNGIILIEHKFKSYIFTEVVNEMIADIAFLGDYEEINQLKSITYGENTETQIELLNKEEPKKEEEIEEKEIKMDLLKRNFLRYEKLYLAFLELVNKYSEIEDAEDASVPDLSICGSRDSEEKRIIYFQEKVTNEGWACYPVYISQLIKQKDKILEEALIENKIKAKTIVDIKKRIEEKFNSIEMDYSLKNLFKHRDFRVLVGLRYLAMLARRIGVESKLEEVLSFPLGSNAISLSELALLYQTLPNGKIITPVNENYSILNMLERVESEKNNVIYKLETSEQDIFSGKVGYSVSEILNKVTTDGTASVLSSKLTLKGLSENSGVDVNMMNIVVPSFGKTGTANDYTNSTFAGYVPKFKENGLLDPANGYTIAIYLGFDDNRALVTKYMKVSGSQGALPIWLSCTEELLRIKKYSQSVNIADLAFEEKRILPLFRYPGTMFIEVDPDSGLKREDKYINEATRYSLSLFTMEDESGKIFPVRFFAPFKK